MPSDTISDADDRARWNERCAQLFEQVRPAASTLIRRAYGNAMTEVDIDDVYASAWASVLKALAKRGSEMDDQELRNYVLTAVAMHARKEIRRRGRRRAGPLDMTAESGHVDSHSAEPDELAIGSEQRAVARDVLMSLPKRRRTVMLLRYGGGMSPKEVCSRIEGLSPRAYRKEITKGVDQMVQALQEVETGEWCERRRDVVRDLCSGVVDEDRRREAELHIAHCRSCAALRSRLSVGFNEAAALFALMGGTAIVDDSAGTWERLVTAASDARELLTGAYERLQEQAIGLAVAGGTRGAGSVGAGAVTKVLSAGAAGKAALACAGAGAAATVCVATGVVPAVGIQEKQADKSRAGVATHSQPAPDANDPGAEKWKLVTRLDTEAAGGGSGGQGPKSENGGARPDKESGSSKPTPEVDTPRAEFDPLAAEPTDASVPPTPTGGGGSSNAGGGSVSGVGSAGATPSRAVAKEEFGP